MLLNSKGGERREVRAEVEEEGRRGVRQKGGGGDRKKKEESNCYCGWEPGFSSTARSPLNPNVTF